ncbi:MAG TPA: helix-turn-helix domain-containing protein [Afipia sp.]
MPDVSGTAQNRAVGQLIGATVADVERELVLQTLARCEGNRTHAARVLGMSLRTLRYKLKHYAEHGIDVPSHH